MFDRTFSAGYTKTRGRRLDETERTFKCVRNRQPPGCPPGVGKREAMSLTDAAHRVVEKGHGIVEKGLCRRFVRKLCVEMRGFA